MGWVVGGDRPKQEIARKTEVKGVGESSIPLPLMVKVFEYAPTRSIAMNELCTRLLLDRVGLKRRSN